MHVAGKIFVNYRRDDAKAEAARLHDRLAQSFGAANVFMDVDNLLPGERFDLRLKEALAGTDVFLAVIGARWLDLLEARAQSGERDYVREEIAAALAAKLVVIPVLMDRAPLPKAASLPEDIRELALYHKHDLAHESFGRDVQALIAAIEAHRQALNEKAASAARLTREQEQAAAEAERRAQQKEKRAEPRPGQAGLPREPFAIMAVAVVVTLLIAQPWQRGAAPSSEPAAVFDNRQLQRGFKVYSEVCDNCHSVKELKFADLIQDKGLGISRASVETFARGYSSRLTDNIPWKFKDDKEAAAAFSGAVPPDLSRYCHDVQSTNLLYSVLTGYLDPPPGTTIPDGMNYNRATKNNRTGMPQPLSDGQVEYKDGTPNTLDQESRDVAAFLHWMATK